MLIDFKSMMAEAEAGNYAVIAPDFPNLMVVQLLLEEAEKLKTPLLLSYAPSLKAELTTKEYRRLIQLVREEIDMAAVPVGLHLDHAFEMDDIKEAIDLGYSSVMIDASREEWDVNIKRSSQIVELACPHGVGVESELGHVAVGGHYGGQSDQNDQQGWLTDPQQAAEFMQETGVDALAVAVGTIHGTYQGKPNLDFARLKKINELVHVPLVLHGASGTGAENLKKAVSLGIRKINVFSDLINALKTELAADIQSNTSSMTGRQPCRKAVQRVMKMYIDAAGSGDRV